MPPKSAAKSSRAAPSQKSAAPKQQQKATQKRKRVEAESDDEDDGTGQDLDAMLGGDSDDDDEEDADDIEIDPAEVAAMAHLYGKKTAAADDEEDEDDENMEDGAESSEDDGEEAGDEGTGVIARPAKKKAKLTFLNNKAALLDKLSDIALPASYPWVETLKVTTNKSFAEATDNAIGAVHDDLKREAAFYELSLNAASEGLQQLTDLNIPFRIPADFFAERVKPDKHMARVKDKLIEEQRKMVAVAERKQDKETRRFAKQVQSAKIQEKSAEKKANLAAAGKMRKAPEGADRELGVERSILPGVSAHLAANRADEAARREKKSAKREAKDKKYGHGGKKRNVRKNDKESATSGKDYTVGKMRQNFQGFKDSKPGSFQDRRSRSNKSETNKNGSSFGGRGAGGASRGGRGGGRGGKPNRPGKSSRASSRK